MPTSGGQIDENNENNESNDKTETLAQMNCFNFIVIVLYIFHAAQAKPNKCWNLQQQI